MQVDALRYSWPEVIRSGQYDFRTLRRDTFRGFLSGHRRGLEVRAGGKPLLTVAEETPQVAPVLSLLFHREQDRDTSVPPVADVIDSRRGMIIGRLERTRDALRPVRTRSSDGSGRVGAVMAESPLSYAHKVNPAFEDHGSRSFTFRADGDPVGRMWQQHRWGCREYRVDARRAAGRVDPLLILACGLQEFAHVAT